MCRTAPLLVPHGLRGIWKILKIPVRDHVKPCGARIAWCDHENSNGVKFIRALHSASRARNRTGAKNRTGPLVGCDWDIAKYINPYVLTKYSPYLILAGELWDVCCEYMLFRENWPRYDGTALYCIIRTSNRFLNFELFHDDVIKWKHFPRNWSVVRGIHRSRWIPHTKGSDAELWCFLWSASISTVE